MKENKRYLNCKYLDAGMDGMLCSMSLCTTCKEFNGEKCDYYTAKDKPKNKEKHTINFGVQECSKCQYKLRCEECVYNEKEIDELIRFEKQLMAKDILTGLECFLWETAINDTKFFDLYQDLYKSIKEHIKNKYGVAKES